MTRLHPRAFSVTVVWTLLLLWLGSVVHATGSSLACPDWPTCYGTMVPEMTGGVFWEHLHRLVAGGLLLMFGLATFLARREVPASRPILRACWAGLGLLLVQSVFGGITVIYQLPDLVSTTHLALAFLFLGLAASLASATHWTPEPPETTEREARLARTLGAVAAGLVFAQSVLGGLVRHMDAGLACSDVPLCLGRVVPPLGDPLTAVHFAHRALGLLAALAVLTFAGWAVARGLPKALRTGWLVAAVLVVVQVALGFLSVMEALAVVPVSLHTLVAASLLVVLVHATSVAWRALPVHVAQPVAS